MFSISSHNTQQKELESLEKTDTRAENSLYPGQNTISLHFELKSNLGWIAWKDREAALYMYFLFFSQIYFKMYCI